MGYRRQRILLYLVIICSFCFSSHQVSAAADYDEGMTAYKSGEYDKAYDIFTQLFRTNPQNEAVNYALGLAAIAKGKMSHALFAFERVVMLNPDNMRAHLEMGRVYVEIGQYELARKEFETVSKSKPPANVQSKIDGFLKAIRRSQKKWFFNGRLDLRLIYDDNINFGPASDKIDTALGELTVVSNSLPQDVSGGAVNLTATCLFDPGEPSFWQISADISAYQDIYDGAPEQEIQFLQGGISLRKNTADFLIDIPLRYSMLNYGHDDLLRISGVNPLLAIIASKNIHFISRLSLEDRDYQDNDDRDAEYYQFTETLRYLIGDSGSSVSINAGAFNEDSDGDAFQNDGWAMGAAAELQMDEDLLLYISAQYREASYGDILYPDLQEEARDDEQLQFIVGLQKRMTKQWKIDFNHRHVDNTSNFELYDYNKNVTSLSTSLSF